jgi:predicted alpha/beta-hydrolase family hydrolase
LKSRFADEESMDKPGVDELRFPPASGSGEVRGILHRPETAPRAGLIIAHGRSGNMRAPFIRKIAEAAVQSGIGALPMNFRYTDERGKASRKLSREEDDLRGALGFLKRELGGLPILVAGISMGARVAARASFDPDMAGLIALGYPLHPIFRPQVRNPPEWPLIVKPTLFVQGEQDPFCDLKRLREELPRLASPHELVVIPNAGHSFEPKGIKRDTFPEVRDAVLEWISARAESRP